MTISIWLILALLALVGGIALLILAKTNNRKGMNLAKIGGYILLTLAFLVTAVIIFRSFAPTSEMKNMTHEQHMNM